MKHRKRKQKKIVPHPVTHFDSVVVQHKVIQGIKCDIDINNLNHQPTK